MSPMNFSFSIVPAPLPLSCQCLYFSFATLSTVGYGDLTARSNLGHTLAISEALLGQIYLVTIVSLLVANLGRSAKPAAEGQETR